VQVFEYPRKAVRFVTDVACGRRQATDALAILDYQRLRKKPLVHLEITSRCNTSCRCCARNPRVTGVPTNHMMSMADIMRVLEPYEPSTIQGIALSGSESLLHPEFFEIVQEITKRFPARQLHLYTNGIVLASDKTTLQRVAALGLGSISYSLHGATQDTISILQPGVPLDGVLAAADYIGENSDTPQWATFVIQDENYLEIPAFVELIGESGFTGLSFVPFNLADEVDGSVDYEAEWSRMDLWSTLEAAQRRCGELGVAYSSSAGLCSCTQSMDVFRVNGSMLPCPGVSRADYVVGNVLTEDFRAVDARRKRTLRAALSGMRKGTTPRMCEPCALRVQRLLPAAIPVHVFEFAELAVII